MNRSAAFIRRRFGEEAVTYLAEPLLAGIHAGDVHRLSMRAAFPRLIDAERSHGSVIRALWSRSAPHGENAQGAFMSLPGGVEELVSALVTRLPGGTLRTGAGVSTIEGTGPFTVHLESGDRVEARAVIVAAPAWAATSILEPLDAEIGRLIGQVRYASSATVAIGVHREQVRHPLQGSGFVVPRPERKALMAASCVSSKWPHRAPQGFALLRGFVGGAYDQGVLEQSDSRIVDAVFAELSSLLGISGTPQLARVYRWPRGSAQHEVGHLERMAEIDRRLAAYPGLFVTGSGFRGTGISDCVADGRATAIRAAIFLS